MNKKLIFIGLTLMIIISFLSGCQEQASTTASDKKFENISLESDLVELAYGEMNYVRDNYGKVISTEVKYLFKNIAGKEITIIVTAEFYDEEDNLLGTGGPKEISLRKGWTEQGISFANIISYSEKNAAEVDHVKIVVKDKFE